MLITLESHHDWVYALHRRLVPGHNYIAETTLKICWGSPTATGFEGYRLLSMYSVRYDGAKLTCSSAASWFGGRVFDRDEAVQVCTDILLKKLAMHEYAGPAEFYSRASLVGCAGVPLMSHERQCLWDAKPVLDERLWKRYVDSINRTAANTVVR